ncbi:hypothetical protein ANCDUO_01513 [Ancylostoma duodenale]|uniref:Uncharacterized protein n=1 Tax=Ancylostoma duodenale TaxID=51022 RepID=A0A0C2H940_9BILA|nr:hypothetical protein ANCDUO_01513 [Ancylostoma duodenale]
MDELTRKRLRSEKGEADDSWLNAMELTELTSQRVNELLQENYSLKSRLCDMEARMDIIAKSQKELMDAIIRKRKVPKNNFGDPGSFLYYGSHPSVSLSGQKQSSVSPA